MTKRKNLWRKLWALLLAAALALQTGAYAAPASASVIYAETPQPVAAEFSLTASAACVIDVDSGRVLYEYNSDEQRPIASITKMMTALIAIERSSEEDLDRVLTTSAYAASVGGSSLYLLEGDTLTLRTALYGTLLRSGNDCAVVVAEAIAGTEEAFCELMNERAAELGMTRTHYCSCNGLPDVGNYSTAHDMALLGTCVINNPLFAEICKTWYLVTPDGYAIENHNKLLNRDARCIGIKNGYTEGAGMTLVTCFQDQETGQRIVCCTLNDPYQYSEHPGIYDWAFATYTPEALCAEGDTVGRLTLEDGSTAVLVASSSVTYPLKEGERLTARVYCPGNLTADAVEAGAEAGYLAWYLDGSEVIRTAVCYGEITS